MGFSVRDGYLFCETFRVKDIQEQVGDSPFYLYSAEQIRENFAAYASALAGIPCLVSYAVKANGNLAVLRILRELGSGATLVSGNELRLALAAGFDPGRMILNGNGKLVDELMLGVTQGAMINIDSEFDLEHIDQAATTVGRAADVLLRVNPDINPDIHPYVSTGVRNSKFGIRTERLLLFLDRMRGTPLLNLVGIHCHLGSTIREVRVFREATVLMMQLLETTRQQGFDPRYLNIGGGLGIDYAREGGFPTPGDLVDSIRDLLRDDITLIIEPGRTIVGNAGVLIGRVIGVKSNSDKNFIVTDASMAELIRPSLYGAYHHIGFVEPIGGEVRMYDVVGPVCESADFLGKERKLPTPHEGAGLVIYDAGAYGYAMSSNYNMRLRPAEYLVDGGRLIQIRRAETLDDHLRLFEPDDRSRAL